MTEHYLSGYCRCLDAARMVEIVIVDGKLDECDCAYGNCKFQSSCPIAKGIETLLEEM